MDAWYTGQTDAYRREHDRIRSLVKLGLEEQGYEPMNYSLYLTQVYLVLDDYRSGPLRAWMDMTVPKRQKESFPHPDYANLLLQVECHQRCYSAHLKVLESKTKSTISELLEEVAALKAELRKITDTASTAYTDRVA